MDKILARGVAAIELYKRPEYQDITRLDCYVELIDKFVTGIGLQSAMIQNPNTVLLVYTGKQPKIKEVCWYCGNELVAPSCPKCCRKEGE